MRNLCPVCNYSGVFMNFRGRARAKCPGCAALERHRLMWLYWQQRTNLFDGTPKRMLHMAPEPCFRQRLNKVPGLEYLTGDLNPKAARAMRKLNLCRLDLPDASFDVVHASHVLEHIHDDLAAMREIRRVLKPTGWAILQVPLRLGEGTYRDPKARTPKARQRAHGQQNHVRWYGSLDYPNRLAEAGLQVTVDNFVESLPDELVARYHVHRHEMIYLCRP